MQPILSKMWGSGEGGLLIWGWGLAQTFGGEASWPDFGGEGPQLQLCRHDIYIHKRADKYWRPSNNFAVKSPKPFEGKPSNLNQKTQGDNIFKSLQE